VDIPRESKKRLRLIRRIIGGIILLGVIGGATWYISRLKRAAPEVDRAIFYIDTVKRGTFPRQVRGMGKLVPEEIRWVPAVTDGRVEKKVLEAGARVTPETVLIELSNPQLQQETVNAEWDWKAEESSYTDLEVRLHREQLSQQAEMAKLESDRQQAVLTYDAHLDLAQSGLYPSLDLKRDKANADQLSNRLEIEKKQSAIYVESARAQLAEKRTRVDQRKALYSLKKSQLDQLRVRAGVEGVLQQILVEVGERVAQGAKLARVANPNKLKAELNVPETQAKDIQIGQEVSIDMRNNILVPGKVSRIDPAVKDGTVAVDACLDGELPKGARPDLSVDGTIVLERLVNVVYIGHPVQGQPDSQVSLFKLDPDGKRAERVPVKLGRSSVSIIEVREGLKPGDRVILSDMSEYDIVDSIRLK
jgi:HlyD family secretion protein